MAACPTGMSVSDCDAISTASRIDISSLVYGDPPVPNPILTSALPSTLQSTLSGCDASGTCKFVGYDFIQNTAESSSTVPYTLNRTDTTASDTAVFVKKTMSTVGISSIVPDGNGNVTVTTTTSHGFLNTGSVVLKTPPYSGTFPIQSVPSATTFTIATNLPCPEGFKYFPSIQACLKNEEYSKCPDGDPTTFFYTNGLGCYNASIPKICPTNGQCPSGYALDSTYSSLVVAGGMCGATSTYPCRVPIPIQACKAVGQEGEYKRMRTAETTISCRDTLQATITQPDLTGATLDYFENPPEFTSPLGFELNNASLTGTPLSVKYGQTNFIEEECAVACTSESACQGFNINTSTNTCEFFSAVSSTVYDSNKIAFQKTPTGLTVDAFGNVTMPGSSSSTISSLGLLVPENTGADCLNMKACNDDIVKTLKNAPSGPFTLKTTTLKTCKGCIPKTYARTATASLFGPLTALTNEFKIVDATVLTMDQVISKMTYMNKKLTVRHDFDSSEINLIVKLYNLKSGYLFDVKIGSPIYKDSDTTSPLTYSTVGSSYYTRHSLNTPAGLLYKYQDGTSQYYSSAFTFENVDYIHEGYFIKAYTYTDGVTRYVVPNSTMTGFDISTTSPYDYDKFSPDYNKFVFLVKSSCQAGQKLTGVTCYTCNQNKYCPAGVFKEIPCPAGTYTTGQGSSACIQCPVGSYCLEGVGPQVCPTGSFCPAGSALPTGCPIGMSCPAS
jgi:hypothetical protein